MVKKNTHQNLKLKNGLRIPKCEAFLRLVNHEGFILEEIVRETF